MRRGKPALFYFQCTDLTLHPVELNPCCRRQSISRSEEIATYSYSWVQSPLVCIQHSISSLIGLDRYFRIKFQPIVLSTTFLAGSCGAKKRGKQLQAEHLSKSIESPFNIMNLFAGASKSKMKTT